MILKTKKHRCFRMKLKKMTLVALFPFFFILMNLFSSTSTEPKPLSPDEWIEDLHYMVKQLKEKHRNLCHTVDKEEFEAAVHEMEQKIPFLNEHEIIVWLARIVGMIRDGHTRLTLPVNHNHLGFYQGHSTDSPPSARIMMFHTLPVRFYMYSDGLYIRSSTREYLNILGERVIEIGNTPVDEALESMRPFLAVENESGFKLVAPTRLAIPEILNIAGISEDILKTRLVTQNDRGELKKVFLLSLAYEEKVEWLDVLDHRKVQYPLWLKDTKYYFWFKELKNENAVFVKFNRINNSEKETVAEFAHRLFKLVQDHSLDRIIIDLRHNYGGDTSLARSIILGLIRWRHASTPGHLFVITGRHTFSAAINFANELEQYTHITFVGELIGGKPSHYGDARKSQLPNSNLTLRVSTRYWRAWTGSNERNSVTIDFPVSLSFKEYLSGIDPALESILFYKPPKDLGTLLKEADTNGGINSALLIYYRFSTDPITALKSTEEALNALGFKLLKEKRHRYALAIFVLNIERYPRSSNAHFGRGEAFMAIGSVKEAKKALKKAIEFNPNNTKAKELLERISKQRSRKAALKTLPIISTQS